MTLYNGFPVWGGRFGRRVLSCHFFIMALSLVLTARPGWAASDAGQPPLPVGPLINLFSAQGESALAEQGALPRGFPPALRARDVDLNQSAMTQEGVCEGMGLKLDLFTDAIYTARVDRVTGNVNGTVTIRGRIEGYPLGTLILTTSAGRSLGAVEIPELKKRFAIQNEAGATAYRLVDVDLTRVDNLEGGPSLAPVSSPSLLNQPLQATVSTQSGPLDPVTVDVLIVYTPLARQWADASGGGIANVIAQAMAKAQLALDNSSTFLSLNLVHSEEVAYTEDANSYTNLTRLQNGSDGYMDTVQGLRDLYRADLVSLFVKCEDVGGLGYLLNSTSGWPTLAYCLNRVQQASWTFTMVHEMGHNMGCHHSKVQNVQPGPGLFAYSSGWLWKGSDNGNYCSVMTYEAGSYFADGITRTRVAYFSNPAIQHLGAAAGDAAEGDNARTLREIKGVISAYRTPPVVTLSLSGSPLAEAGGVAMVTATLSSAYWLPVTVTLAFSGTATLAADYTRSGISITIPAGSTSGSITLTAVQDVLDEANETVVVDVDTVVNGTENATQRVTATITDDDPAPTVSLGLSGSPLVEAGGVATVTATLSAVSGQAVTVNLAFSGTATLTADYTRSGSSITIPAGSTSGSIALTAVQDVLDEVNETVVVDIDTVVNGTENGAQQVTATITDDDPGPAVSLGLSGSPLAEAGGVATVTATLLAVSGQAVTVNLAFSGTATLTADYTRSGTSITIPAGSTSGSITLTAVQDVLDEANETVVVDIDTVVNGAENGAQQVTATITDDDPGPAVSLGLSGSPLAEAGGVATVTATLLAVSGQAVTVNLAFSGTAILTADYIRSGTSITIPAGSTSGSITLTAVQDVLDEANETVVVDIDTVVNGAENGAQQVTATITDDDPGPAVSLGLSGSPLAEAGGVATVTATLSTVSGQAVTVNLAFSGTATLADDYTPSGTSITIPAGSTSGSITLTAVQEVLDETNETVVVDIDTVVNGTENGSQQVTATITDDDPGPAVSLGLSGSPLAEAGGVATVTATLLAVSGQAVTVNLAFSGTATLTSDYTRSGTSITIPAGSTSGSITLTAVQDVLDEANETVVVDIDTVVNGTENGSQRVTATITDDDPGPVVSLGLSGSPLAEAGGVATVTATLSAASGQAVTVNLAFSGTATLTADYTRSGTSITIPAGSTSGSVTLTAVQDTLNEANETVVVDVSTVVNGTENGTQQVTATITDDDPVPGVNLGLSGSPLAEAGGVATVTATLLAVSGQAVTVNLAFSGTAALTADYTRSGTSITIPAGSVSGSRTLTAVQDALNEANETVVVDVSTVVNGTENGAQQVTATITDDDPVPGVNLSLSGSPLAEAGGVATVTATLSAVSGQAVTVNLAFSGTATLADDYSRSGTSITIAAGSASGFITLRAVQDVLNEVSETVVVDIDTVINGVENDAQQVTASITDDESPTVMINQAAGQADPTNGMPVNFIVVFSEPVTDFDAADVMLGGTAGATTAVVSGNGTTYNVAVSGMTGSGTVLATILAGQVHDVDGNGNAASSSTDNTVMYDLTLNRQLALTYPQGGESFDVGTTVGVIWATGGVDWRAGDTVRLEVSTNSGAQWSPIAGAGSLPYDLGLFNWSTAGWGNCLTCRIRVSWNDPIPLGAVSAGDFAVRRCFYVNDVATNLDAWCTAPGNNGNMGQDAAHPKATVPGVLGAYTLVPGDTVRIDTGIYTLTNDISVPAVHSGIPEAPVVFEASPYGVTLNRNSTALGIVWYLSASNVTVRTAQSMTHSNMPQMWMKVLGGRVGVWAKGASARLNRLDVYSNVYSAVWFDSTAVNGVIENSVIRDMYDSSTSDRGVGIFASAASVTISNCTFFRNATSGILLTSSTGTILNNIIHADGVGRSAIRVTYSVASDYNDLFVTNGAVVGYYSNVVQTSLTDWRLKGMDSNSLSVDPRFVNPALKDVHLQSTVGSYHGGAWTADGTNSLCLDMGLGGAGLEPVPNTTPGYPANLGQMNLGAYGGTEQASMTPQERGVTLLAPMDGEIVVNRTMPLPVRWAWIGQGWQHEDTVRLEYSIDAGQTWSGMAGGSGVAVTNGVFPWDISSVPDSLLYLVRVTCIQDGAISGQSPGVFSIGPPFVALSLSGTPLAEAGGVATVTATLSSVYELPVTVNLTFSGLATLASDYVASAASITIPSGSSSGSITLTAVQDTLDETNETIVVDIDTVENGTENGVQQVKATITDDDPLPAVSLSLTNSLLAEAAGVATVTASMSAVSGRPVTVNLAFSGTATPSDYTASGASITIPEGSTNGSLTLTAVQDALNEANETLVVDISSVVSGTESGSQQVTATILDDDPMPAVSLSLTNSPMAEAGGVAMVTAALSSISGQNVTVNLAFSGTGTLTNDWRRSAAFITVLKGSLRGSVTLTAVQDTLDEANETIVVDIDTVVNATKNGVQQVTAIITDDDTADRQLRVTYPNQGEVLDVGSPVGIIWAASGVDWLPGDTVRLEVSTNSGAAWSPIAGAASLAYNLGTFSWVTTGLVNLAACRIQVSWNENPGVTDTSDTDFTMRRCFYVNDGSVEHDEWCGAVGSDANTGLDSGHPKATVQGVLSAYTLVPGDTVRLDAGEYALTNGVRVGQEHSGNPAAPVVFEASAYGVTVALQNTGEAVWDIHASNVIVRTARSVTNSSAAPSWMKVMGGSMGVNTLGREVCLSRLDICSNAFGGACLAGEKGVIENSLVRDVAGGDGILVFAPAVTIRSCTVSGNAQCGINVGSPDGVRIVNNIIRADGAGKYALSWLSTAGSLFSDYNDLFVTNGAAVGSYGAAVKATLAEWALTGRDLNSLSADPQWVSMETGDFHLKSVQGRYVSPDQWTNDTAHSACIDAGDPASGSADEPIPNGTRINIGAYGNTEQASRSLTNLVVMLEVRSAMGSTIPLAGVSLYYPGTILFCQNSGSPVQMGSTQYVCVGWVMQGNEPGAGETNVLTLTLTNNAVLTWLWQALVEPRIAAVPGSLDFGTIQVGTSVEAELSLQNAGGGMLNGEAALSELSGPFSLVSGGLYGLATGVTHLVRVRYYPDSEGSHSNGVVFTGGGGLTCGMFGRALGNGDSDRDGMSDWNEYLAGTSPSNDASVFAVKGVTLLPGIGVEIQWSASSNQTYMLERGTNLVSGEFAPLFENIPSTPPVNVHTDFVSGVIQGYFYRIKTTRAVE